MSNTAHQIVRPNVRSDRYDGRAAFLALDTTLRTHMQQACGAPAVVVSGDDQPASAKVSWRGQPWLTPILGSGPLGLPAAFVALSQDLPNVVADKVTAHRVFHAFRGVGADEQTWIQRFVAKMIEQRSGDEPYQNTEARPLEEVGERIRESTYLLILISAQLTRAFHRISLDTCRPISRWGSELASLPQSHDRQTALRDEYTNLLSAACNAAETALKKERSRSPAGGIEDRTITQIVTLVETIRQFSTTDSPTITILHLHQVTEVAWYRLVSDVVDNSYPGWTDLMLRLVLADGSGVKEGHKRPRVSTIENLASQIRSIVEPASLEAWTHANDSEDRIQNRDFYNSVARSLWAQAAARRAWAADDSRSAVPLPQPIAFVCSFDYELEMALWRTAHEFTMQSFSVVVPTYAFENKESEQADFVWLEGRVTVGDSLDYSADRPAESAFDAMRTLSRWRACSSRREVTSFDAEVVVVRLAGCPLISLPNVTADVNSILRNDLASIGLGGVTGFFHSVTVDEYLAVRQTEAEWQWSRDSSDSGKPSRALPVQYLQALANAPRRYWMILGVPFRDPAVRLRILAVLTRQPATRVKTTPEGGEPLAEADADATAGEVTAAPPPHAAEEHDPKRAGPGEKPRLGFEREGRGKKRDEQPSERDKPPSTALSHESSSPDVVDDETGKEALSDEQGDATNRRGLAINTRVDDEETMLLNALGFTVISDRCESFTVDLSEYADWIADISRRIQQLDKKKQTASKGASR